MGIYSRDYLREESSGRPAYVGGNVGSVCKWIIIANVVVFLLQEMTGRGGGPVTQWLAFNAPDVLYRGQAWRLLTYAFCHGGVMHILFNMLFVWWFGKTLEYMYGSREFLWFYLTAALFAGLCHLGLSLVLGNSGLMYGASGAVMAIMMIYAIYYPRQRILLMMIIPIEIRWLVAGYIIFDSLPVIRALSGQAPTDHIAHAAHLGGLLFGYLYYRYNIRLTSFLGRFQLPRIRLPFGSRSKIRIYRPPMRHPQTKEKLDDQVDAILAKIHEQGEASLTDSEREILKQASRQYKNR